MKRTKTRILTLIMVAILVFGVCSVALAASKLEVDQVVYARSFKAKLYADKNAKDGKILMTPGAGQKVKILEIDGAWARVSITKTYPAKDGSLVDIETFGYMLLSDLIKEMPQPSGGGVEGGNEDELDQGCPYGECGHPFAEHSAEVAENGLTVYRCPG